MSIKAGSQSIILAAVATLCVASGQLRAQQGGPASRPATPAARTGAVSAADRKFLTDVAHGGEAEVELAKLAQEKAADARVKEFASRMDTDHSKGNSELRAMLVGKQITVPGGPGPHAATKAKLEKLQGATFDHAYMAAMVDDHVKTVAAFEMESKTTKDSDIKAFTEKMLPTLREHLKMAQDIQRTAKP